MSSQFVHLSVHSEFSLKNSLVRIKPLIKALKEKEMHAITLSDPNNLFAAIRFYQQSMSAGIKPIISSEIIIADENQMGKVNLICKDDIGYKNLLKIISAGFDKPRPDNDTLPVYELEELEGLTDGLICLTGAKEGQIGKSLLSGNSDYAVNKLTELKKTFSNRVFIELQRIGHPDDDRYVQRAVELAVQNRTPVVATNPVRFLTPEEFKTHEIRVAIGQGKTLTQYKKDSPLDYTHEQYLKSPEEMTELFRDIPSAIENTVAIAQGCNVDLTLGKNFLPAFPIPDDIKNESESVESYPPDDLANDPYYNPQSGNATLKKPVIPEKISEADYLEIESKKGLEERLITIFGEGNPDINELRKPYDERLEFELNVINEMGFPGYFLIVMEFIQWSKEQNIPVGPGRGSGAGSLVAYATKITDLDPLEYDLLFERFLNPERVSMPDFDIDFCMDRRDEVIQHTAELYGHKSVSQIITFGTMAAKNVVKGVTRSLGYPYSVGERISKMIPNTPGIKLQDAIDEDANFTDMVRTDPEVKEIMEHALKLEGITLQTGKHAGGVLIAPGDLTDYTPTYSEYDGAGFVSQFDKNDVETAGLVKFDYLGLRTLTIVQWAIDSVNEKRKLKGELPLDISNIPLDDPAVYDIYSSGKTTAVFQVESRGMKELLTDLKPDCFEDIIALVALYRPGPLESGMVGNFVNRKHGREEISYPDPNYQHECLKEILEPTYGIILYQEQVMQIAQKMAGYTLGEADMLRRAMGKKKPEEMAKQRGKFREGAVNSGIDPDLAMKIFDLVEKFAGYGFNKSHSAAYALVSYQTAWLKAHYPAEFMAAVLSSDMDNTDKVVNFIQECKDMGINVVPPQANVSKKKFVASKDDEIVYGLEAVKGVGEKVIDVLVEERELNGPYATVHDLAARTKLNKRVMEASVKAGVLDGMGPNRHSMMSAIPDILEIGKQAKEQNKHNQGDLFGSIIEDEEVVKFDNVPEWNNKIKLKAEKDTLGLFLSGHPLDEYERELPSLVSGKFADYAELEIEDGDDVLEGELKAGAWTDKYATIAGYVVDIAHFSNSRGNRARLVVDDKSRQMDVWVYSKTFNDCQHLLNTDNTLVIKGKITYDKKKKRHKMIAFNVNSIDMARDQRLSHISIKMEADASLKDKNSKLQVLLSNQDAGHIRVNARISKNGLDTNETRIGDYQIKLTDEFLDEVKIIFGDENIEMVYKESGDNSANISRVSKEELAKEKERLKEEGNRTREQRHNEIATLLYEAREAMGM